LRPPLRHQVVITGTGCISAAGMNVREHHETIEQKKRNSQQVPKWLFDTQQKFPVFICPQQALTEIGHKFLLSCNTDIGKHSISRTVQLLISAVAEAIEMSGLSVSDLRKKRVGIAIGTTVGCAFNNEDYYKSFMQGLNPPLNPVIDYLNSNLAYWLQTIMGVDGPSLVVVNACASGTDAIGIAGSWLSSGLCDVAIAGGADELSRIAYNGFISLQLYDLSPCRPFDKSRNGLNLGEGAGIVLLEKEEEVTKQNRTIGWLLGYGTSSDAWHPTAPHPEGQGVVRAAKLAATEAGDINLKFDLINAHGTATRANDKAETNALAVILNAHRNHTPIISTKGITGHTLGAAGAIEAILTLYSLKQEIIGGTIGCHNIDPDLKVIPLSETEKVKLTGRIGLSQSLAFGGGNSALIVEAI